MTHITNGETALAFACYSAAGALIVHNGMSRRKELLLAELPRLLVSLRLGVREATHGAPSAPLSDEEFEAAITRVLAGDAPGRRELEEAMRQAYRIVSDPKKRGDPTWTLAVAGARFYIAAERAAMVAHGAPCFFCSPDRVTAGVSPWPCQEHGGRGLEFEAFTLLAEAIRRTGFRLSRPGAPC
jgi:hypothetical protein